MLGKSKRGQSTILDKGCMLRTPGPEFVAEMSGLGPAKQAKRRERGSEVWAGGSGVWGQPLGQPLTYDFNVITREACHDLVGLSLPVRSTTSWPVEIDRKRFPG